MLNSIIRMILGYILNINSLLPNTTENITFFWVNACVHLLILPAINFINLYLCSLIIQCLFASYIAIYKSSIFLFFELHPISNHFILTQNLILMLYLSIKSQLILLQLVSVHGIDNGYNDLYWNQMMRLDWY